MTANQIAVYPIPKPQHFWPMNEGTGATFFDHAGTLNLAATSVTWATTTGLSPNPVAQFDGSTSSAVTPTVDPDLQFNGATPFSISCWINTNITTSEAFFGNLDASGGTYRGWELTTGGQTGIGVLLVNNAPVNDIALYLDGVTQPTSTPILIVLTYDGSNTAAGTKLYLNGVLTPVSSSGVLTTTVFTSPQPFLVGSRNDGTNKYNGAMAFMRTWNKVILQPGHVAALLANGPQ